MPVAVEPRNLGDLIVYEAPQGYSRTVTPVSAVEVGSVVNKSGALIEPGGSAAVKNAVGIKVSHNTIFDRHAIVKKRGLVFPDEITDEQKTAAINDLNKLGIRVE